MRHVHVMRKLHCGWAALWMNAASCVPACVLTPMTWLCETCPVSCPPLVYYTVFLSGQCLYCTWCEHDVRHASSRINKRASGNEHQPS